MAHGAHCMLQRATAGTIAFMYFSPCVALFAMAVAQAVFHNWCDCSQSPAPWHARTHAAVCER